MSIYRTYTTNNKLISWTDRHCECGRFLSKRQHKHCSDCVKIRPPKEEHTKAMHLWRKNNPVKARQARLREFERRRLHE